MKKVITVSLMLLAMLIALTSCGDKTALSANEFKAKAEAKGMTCEDESSRVRDFSYIQSWTAASSGTDWKADFFVIIDESTAINYFDNHKVNLDEKISSGSGYTENSDNHSAFEEQGEGKYVFVSRVANTVLSIETTDNFADAAKAFVQDLGY